MPSVTSDPPIAEPVQSLPPLVLVVDDDPVILMTLSVELVQAGFRVTEAGDGEEAIGLCATEMPAVVIADYCLPGMSGAELAAQLNTGQFVPVIFLSALSDERIVTEAIASGAFVYLVKPIDPPRLLPVIQAALHRAEDLRAGWLTQRGEGPFSEQELRTISVVTGLVMERFGLNHIDAFHRLRQYARSQRLKTVDVAAALLDATNRANRMLAAIHGMSGRPVVGLPPAIDRRPVGS